MSKDNFLTLDQVLSNDKEKLTALNQGKFYVRKLKGEIPFSEIEPDEHKQAKKDSTVMVPREDRSGGMVPDLDEDKLMVKIIVQAVDKDKRSNFTFADKKLLDHLGVATADAAVKKLLSTGEIYNFAMEVQEISGFGPEGQKQEEAEVKN